MLNVTIFSCISWLVIDSGLCWVLVLSSSSNSLELHRVSLLVDSSSGMLNRATFGCIGSGLWSFLNHLMHMWVRCSPLHSSHWFGSVISFLSTWLMWGPVYLLGGTVVNVWLAWGLVSLLSRTVSILVHNLSSLARMYFLNFDHSVMVIDLRKACILLIFVSVGFWLAAHGHVLLVCICSMSVTCISCKVEVIRNQHPLYKQNLTVAFPPNSFTSQVNPNISYKMVDRNTLNDSVR